jgi:hypothetical protein
MTPARSALAALALALLAPPTMAPAAQAAVERPMVFAIVIDGLDGDRVDASRMPFVASLLSGRAGSATLYRRSRSVMVAETNPNHVAMVTGAYGARSGVPANAFALYAPLADGDSCRRTGPVDATRLPTRTSGQHPDCLRAETVFQAIRRQGNPDGLVTAGVFGKPKLGRMFAPERAPGRWSGPERVWAPCDPDDRADDGYCAAVRTTPLGYAADAIVMDAVLDTLRRGAGPRRAGRRPDFTFVNLSQVDERGHLGGIPTGAYDLAIREADRQVERLVAQLRAQDAWRRTVLLLLSDHSMDARTTTTDLEATLTSAGIPRDAYLTVVNGNLEMVYLANRRSPERFELLRRMRAAALAAPGVAEALFREPNPVDGGRAHALAGAHPEWRLAAPRTGDLVVTHRPGGAFTPVPGNHGAPHTRDNLILVAGGGRFVRRATLAGRAVNVDVASTVMGLFGLAAPRDDQGRFLRAAFRLRALPGRGRPSLRPRVRVRRTACRAGRVRLRVSWGPRAGRFDAVIRSANGVRRLRGTRRTAVAVASPAHGRLAVRVRLRAASGVPGRWARRAVRTRGC